MVTKIYLIRHAEAEGNAVPFFQGSLDTCLTEKGEQQLDYLAARFCDIPLEAIYFSPFQRTRLTAEAVNRNHGLEMIPEYELREINGGKWEGRRIADLHKDYPEAFRLWREKMHEFAAPDGATMCEVYDRMRKAVQHIAEENPGRTIAVFTHGCALRNFLSFVESGTIEGRNAVGWGDNTAVSLAEYETGWRLIYKNNSAHLPQGAHTALPM